MTSVDYIDLLKSTGLIPATQAQMKMKKSLQEVLYAPGFEARILFIGQVISSIITIPLLLIATFYITLWQLIHCDLTKALYTTSAGAINSGLHTYMVFASAIAFLMPLSWTNASIDCFQIEKPKIISLLAEA